ncbi:MAG: HAMP domain-containing sensor histidine kinase [Burkholderiaceae bacterium]|nr:HAMP domain-containing sensor histidine kinase [Burkholderiaceae bacterium]
MPGVPGAAREPWHVRARQWLGHSIKVKLVLVFLLLAVAVAFLLGARQAFTVGWREAARPLLMDYVDHLAAEVVGQGPPSTDRAQAIAQRLPVTVRIEGPQVQWQSHPELHRPDWLAYRAYRADREPGVEPRLPERGTDWQDLLQRRTADGHVLTFGLNPDAFERRPRLVGYTLAVLLLLTLLAFLYTRRLLRPLDDIGAGAQRFGAGDFTRPIAVRHAQRPDELGQLAQTINTMGQDIHQMLEAKRGLLLAISHELRSPLTRARLHTELLPEGKDIQPQRDALLRDLQDMGQLINDLLESERLAGGHAALQREPTDLAALVREVVAGLHTAGAGGAPEVVVDVPPDGPLVWVDPTRVRLLLRNLLYNSLRHAAGAARPPEVAVAWTAQGLAAPAIEVVVRDHGPGVPDDQLSKLSQAFHRPDSARTRSAGGVGLGLYLCRLVAQAHGGTLSLSNAQPGLRVVVSLPLLKPPQGLRAR